MALLVSFILISILQIASTQTLPTWPSPVNDELEDIMYLSTGYRARRFADPVTPCSKPSISGSGPGRFAAAEWLRTSFHDVASGNMAIRVPTGGLDASIVYELGRTENDGPAFTSTVATWEPFFGPRAPMSEIIAIGTYTSVRGCGGLPIPVRLGRVDATVAGPDAQVPQPQDGLPIFRNRFLRLNMGDSEMVQITACGHTLGAVHANNQPLIVTTPNTFKAMDSTDTAFDERIATEFVSGNTTNPLVVGPSVASKRNSDFVVNSADNNATIRSMTDPTVFQNSCQKVFQKMIECVPGGAGRLNANSLTPYEVKPYALQLYLQNGGSALTFAGDIRVRTTNRPQSSIASVSLVYKDRTGAGSSTIPTTFKDTAAGLDDSFAFYTFNTSLPSSSSISSFIVQISYTNGNTDTFNNNGASYPISDTLLLQYPQSCSSDPSTITVTAAVRNTTSGTPNLNFLGRRYNGIIIVPTINTTTVPLQASLSVGPYNIYNVTIPLNATQSAKGYFSVTLPGVNPAADLALLSTLPSTCGTLSAAKPTPSTWTYLACQADNFPSQPRALGSGPFQYSSATNISSCAAFCSTYQYFGLEYSQECYCGAYLAYNTSSSNCNMPCSGDASSTCGGPGALSLYSNNLYKASSYPNINGWVYQGCYTDDVGNRTVQGLRLNDNALTLEKAAADCDAQGFSIMGTEYHSEIYCSNALGGTGTQVPDAQCDTVCSGDGQQACGGANRVSVYARGNVTVAAGSRRRWIA